MRLYSIQAYQKPQPAFSARKSIPTEQIADLRVFHHHIYEYKKGIRNLILTTEKSKYKTSISERLDKENIDYLIHDIAQDKINVYFGAKECVDVVKSFKNTIDVILANGKLEEDKYVGYIQFNDGKRRELYYH